MPLHVCCPSIGYLASIHPRSACCPCPQVDRLAKKADRAEHDAQAARERKADLEKQMQDLAGGCKQAQLVGTSLWSRLEDVRGGREGMQN